MTIIGLQYCRIFTGKIGRVACDWVVPHGAVGAEGIGKQVDISVGIVGKGEKWMLQIGKSRLRPMMVWSARRSFSFGSLRQGSQDMASHCRSGVERNDGDECGGPKVN